MKAPNDIFFLFPGHGSERVNMCRQLYQQIDLFQQEVDACLQMVDQQLEFDLRKILFPDVSGEEFAESQIHQTVIAQPALFVMEYSLARTLQKVGLKATGMLGHSVSEYVAACLAGVMSVDTAIKIVVKRGQLAQSVAEGAMLAVTLSEEELQPYMGPEVSMGSTIGESHCVLSGYPEAIGKIQQTLDAQGVVCKPVRVTRAFHSVMLDPILEEFGKFVAEMPLQAPATKYISGVTGDWIDDAAVQTSEYWVKQLRDPVRFYEGISKLSQYDAIYVEVGKGGMLSSLVKTHPLIKDDIPCFLTCPPSYIQTPEVDYFVDSLQQISALGYEIDLSPLNLTNSSVSPKAAESSPLTPVNDSKSPGKLSLEQQVHQHFCQILGVKEVDHHQNFLEIGGNSLMGMQVISRIRESMGKNIPLKEFFVNPTVAGITDFIKQNQKQQKVPKIKAVPRKGPSRKKRSTETATRQSVKSKSAPKQTNLVDFSLFFFSGDMDANPENRYQLVMDGAKFADQNNFDAIWIPERHFNKFGGLYPNPSVLGAAIAAVTENVHVRGGSVVAPLHHPVRIAEEWSLLDNLSRGRCGVSFGSGFHPKDFILAPSAFEDRKNIMFDSIQRIQELWNGGTYEGTDGSGSTLQVGLFPKPYSPALPMWLSTTRSQDTFREAGELGFNVLTALLRLSIPELKERVKIYREAREKAGHDPKSGKVTLMLHTFVGPDMEFVTEHAQSALKDYLQSHMEHTMAVSQEKADGKVIKLSEQDQEELLNHAFERYTQESSLIGTEESCQQMMDKFLDSGVNEVACLIDFGVSHEAIQTSLGHLDSLRRAVNKT